MTLGGDLQAASPTTLLSADRFPPPPQAGGFPARTDPTPGPGGISLVKTTKGGGGRGEGRGEGGGQHLCWADGGQNSKHTDIASYRLNSKEPPETFVPKILIAQIGSFQGLHQPKPGQEL